MPACYHYVPGSIEAVDQGTPVRAHLEPRGSFDLPGLTAHEVVRLDGEFISRNRNGLFVSATWLDAEGGRGFPGVGWTVRLDERTIQRFEVRRLSWVRTGAVLAGLAVGTYLGFDAIRGSGGSGGQSGDGGRSR